MQLSVCQSASFALYVRFCKWCVNVFITLLTMSVVFLSLAQKKCKTSAKKCNWNKQQQFTITRNFNLWQIRKRKKGNAEFIISISLKKKEQHFSIFTLQKIENKIIILLS